MTEKLNRPSAIREISTTKHRVHTLERRLFGQGAQTNGYVAKWSLGGPLYISESGPEIHPRGGRLLAIYAGLRDAGTTTTTLSIRKNGSEIAQLNLLANVTYNEVQVSVPFAARFDTATVAITAAGSGANSISVFGVFDV